MLVFIVASKSSDDTSRIDIRVLLTCCIIDDDFQPARCFRNRLLSALRAPEGLRAPVSIDAILEALCELDGGPRNPPGGKPQRRFSTARTLQPEEDRMNELHLSRQAIELSEPAAAGRQSVSSERGPVAPGRASPPVGFRLLSPSPSFRCGLRKFQGLLTYVEGSRNGTMASL